MLHCHHRTCTQVSCTACDVAVLCSLAGCVLAVTCKCLLPCTQLHLQTASRLTAHSLLPVNFSRPAVYRLITAPLVHGSIMHLLFNMLALVPIASGLERSQGTLHLAALLAVLILLGNAGYVLLASLVQIASTLLSLQ